MYESTLININFFSVNTAKIINMLLHLSVTTVTEPKQNIFMWKPQEDFQEDFQSLLKSTQFPFDSVNNFLKN